MAKELTPMMQQYRKIKEENPGYILFYRLGDFYEMFFDDAVEISRVLDLVLTGRDCGLEERAPMCGIPYHSAEGYIARLVARGYKIAVCEQVEDPKTTKGLVRREIVRRITPGTVVDPEMLEENRNNYIACLYEDEAQLGLCFADISTGLVYATAPADWDCVRSELGQFMPREVLLGGTACTQTQFDCFLHEALGAIPSTLDASYFWPDACTARVEQQFSEAVVQQSGLHKAGASMQSLGGLLLYLQQTQADTLPGLRELQFYRAEQYMQIDATACQNLELFQTLRSREKRGSLLWVIDKTITPMGGRLLRRCLEKPLSDPGKIGQRQCAIGLLVEDPLARSELRDTLRPVRDFERLLTRIRSATGSPRDLLALAHALAPMPALRAQAQRLQNPTLQAISRDIDPLDDISEALLRAINPENTPKTVREGGIFCAGYDENVDRLRELASGGKAQLLAIEQKERAQTGINKLKVGYNRVFGYYIEVGHAYASSVPAHYVRKQTLSSSERYVTPELKELEQTILSAQEQLNQLEYALFQRLRLRVAEQGARVQTTARAVAQLDVLSALAELAATSDYVCPTVDHSDQIVIQNGRHPVVEKLSKDELFTPNDVLLDGQDNRVVIITGPNMAGKSTYMRQVALIVILAQIGSFVPASHAHIGVCDRVFTRIGAADDLTGGQSTFMVEMREVASILEHATPKSLLILDEIGRGTSTYDGMSIARAVIEHIADRKVLGARTLFATHYHELTVLEDTVSGVRNYNIAVEKRGEELIFLRKIVRGGADESFGIEAAQLAGVPKDVIVRARQLLAELEGQACTFASSV